MIRRKGQRSDYLGGEGDIGGSGGDAFRDSRSGLLWA